MLRTIKCFLFIMLICSVCSTTIYGYTVDDVRDLLGKERVDETFTESEISLIVEQYEKIEKANLYVKLFDMGKEIDITSDLLDEYKELEKELVFGKEHLSENFQTGVALDEVLKNKSNVESIMYKISALRDIGYEIEVEYIPNIWEEKYNKVQNMVENLSDQFDIGEVGKNMKIPLNNSFIITSPFGLRLNPLTKDVVSMHYGIDFASPMNTYVYSQWNGIVSKIYESKSGGKTIEISHGEDLKTVYMHLNEIKVEIGQRVKQYELIALSGNTGGSTGPHLHFGVYLDGSFINPIYLFGDNGLIAFKSYISSNPERNLELKELEKLIKNKPSKLIEESEIIIEPSTNLILDVSLENYFNKNNFYENIYSNEKIEKNSEEEVREAKKQEMLKELLNE